jgi:hypothetical protein
MPRGSPALKLAITVDRDVHAKVVRAAKAEHTSVSAWMTAAARRALLVKDGLAAIAAWEADHGALSNAEIEAARLGYTSGNCTGTPYVLTAASSGATPRYSTILDTQGTLGTQAYVIPDNVAATLVAIGSWSISGCSSASAQMAIPVSSLVKVTAPSAAPGTPPYHPEIQ